MKRGAKDGKLQNSEKQLDLLKLETGKGKKWQHFALLVCFIKFCNWRCNLDQDVFAMNGNS